MAAIDAIASPLNPLVCNLNKSSATLILEVACRSNDSLASIVLMPFPLSITCIKVFPASLIISCIDEDEASIEFSNNSLTTEAGL